MHDGQEKKPRHIVQEEAQRDNTVIDPQDIEESLEQTEKSQKAGEETEKNK